MPFKASHVDDSFDPLQLQQRCLNSAELAQRVVRAFLLCGAESVAGIEKSAAAQQWTEVASAAHRLKGASQNVAAGRLTQRAKEIEASAKLHPESLDSMVAALWDEWQRFQSLADSYLNTNSDSTSHLDGEPVAED